MAPLLHTVVPEILIDVIRFRHVDAPVEDHLSAAGLHPDSL